MSTIFDKKISEGYKFHIERYDSAMEVADNCRKRKITDSRFDDKSQGSFGGWEGVKSYDEALDYMRNGYQPTVDSMRDLFKVSRSGEGTRFAFQNQIAGFAPIVPLALKGVPNCMMNMTMKPIKAKVADIYYDMTASCSTSSDQIMDAGKTLLGTIIEMERQGYRFNLYCIQSYSETHDCDMLVVKVKDARQPLDLKRISFPLTHTGFFRVVGFDWYSRVPGGRYRSGYGRALSYTMNKDRMDKAMKELFGKNVIAFSAVEIINNGKEYIKKEVENNGNCKAR